MSGLRLKKKRSLYSYRIGTSKIVLNIYYIYIEFFSIIKISKICFNI